MKHILIFGASATHGVGGEHGGWADKLKAALHSDMFGSDPVGEKYAVYELGVPGETLQDVLGRLDVELKPRIRDSRQHSVYIVFSGGMNDAKAVDAVDNHPLSPDDFAATVHSFIHLAKDYSAYIIGVGVTPVDESKTNPKANPFTGGASFFKNERVKSFEDAFRRTCESEGVYFVPTFAQVPEDWQQNYLFADGLHPNDAGHQWICSQVEPRLRELLGPAHD
jgi:lysophospholipase L1-like esterase